MIIKSGIIENDETWSGEIRVRGDVVIPEHVSVRVAPGSRIRFDRASVFESDAKRNTLETLKMPVSGIDRGRCYIVVHGAWEVLGGPDNRVVIGNEDWGGGILLLSGKDCGIRHALITHAAYGICAMGPSKTTIEHSEIAHCAMGIFCQIGEAPPLIEHNTIQNNTCGIVSYYYDPGKSRDVHIRKNTIAGNALYGIFCSAMRPVIRENRILRNDTGISQTDCEASRIEQNEISGNRIGIHSSGIVSAEIAGNRISDSAHAGIFNQKQVTRAVIAGNELARDEKAIVCDDVKEGVLRDNTITDAGVGIEVDGASGVLIAGGAVHAKRTGIVYCRQSSGSVEGTTITGEGGEDAVGIRVGGTAEVKIVRNAITGVRSGIQCVEMARIIVEENTIAADTTGMSCTGQASGVIRDNTIAGAGGKK